MASAVQPRINKAIEDALRADTSLIELLRAIGGLTAIPTTLPLYWYMAPPSAALPYLVYGPQTRTEETEPLRCGDRGLSEIVYEVRVVTKGITPADGIAIVDKIGDILDGLQVVVEGLKVSLLHAGGVCYPEFATQETAVTHSGLIYRAQVV